MLPRKLPCINHPPFFCSLPYCVIMHAKFLQSCLSLVTLWAVSCQIPLSMGFSRQEYWVDCHFLLQEIFLTQESNPGLLHLLHWQAGSLPLGKEAVWEVLFSLLYPLNANLPLLSLMLPHFLVYGEVKTFSWTKSFSPQMMLSES